jgi:serine/threonine-protein kinase
MDLREQLQHTLGSTYTFERELGGGGMARVFVATETRLRRSVVVKVMSPDLAADISAERFGREIQVAASLQQANIVPVLSAGDMGGVPYYTMPYVDGQSLRALLATHGPLPIRDVVGILRDVAHALSYAHGHGVVHRDIKPDNILLSHGTAVVTDFGIAKAISVSRTAGGHPVLTQAGSLIGTPAYMSPEQVAGDPTIDHRTDVYALGCTAYELLTGQPPFARESAATTLAAHLTDTPKPAHELRPETPPALATLVMRCLEKQPGDRPASADEVAQALDAVATPNGAKFSGGLPRRIARARWRLIGAALGLLIILGGLIVWRARTGAGVVVNKSVAVLPLKNLHVDTANAYFGEGLATEIANALSTAGVRVIGTGSARDLVEQGVDVRAIAKRLGVAYVLLGSLQQAGENIRITMTLSARDGATVWNRPYNVQFKDVFAVQDSIAHNVATELQITLATGPRAAPAQGETKDPEAHVLYLQAMRLWDQRTPATIDSAIARFERAVKHDSLYARAYAGLALSYATLPDYKSVDPRASGQKAINAARQALALDSTLADAWAAIGSSEAKVWSNARAESAFRHAIALDPSSATAHHWYALVLQRLGRPDAALKEIDLARENDPTAIIMSNVGAIRLLAGDASGAETVLRQSLELDSTYSQTHFKLGMVFLERGLAPQAAAEFERVITLGSGARQNVGLLALAYVLGGRIKEARGLLGELTTTTSSPEGGAPGAAVVALIYLELGDRAEALRWLQRGVDGFDPFLANWSRWRRFDSLRADPRGKALLDRVESME